MTTTHTDKDLVQGVLNNTVNTLATLNELNELYGQTDSLEELRELANESKNSKELIELISELYNNADYSDGYTPASLWLSDVLAITQEGHRELGNFSEWVATGTRVTISWGGPNVYLFVNNDSQNLVRVEVYWGSDSAKATKLFPEIVNEINLLVDAYL